MNYLVKSREKKPQRNLLKIIAILILVALFIWLLSANFSQNILLKIGTPLWKFSNSVVTIWNSNIETFRSKKSLIEENKKLSLQIENASKDLLFFDLVKKENETLKDFFNRKKQSENLTIASILVKPGISPYDIIIVDAGKNDGIFVGEKVMADVSVFIGEVVEVYDYSSKIKLYSSPGEKISVLIGPNNVTQEAMGVGDGNFTVQVPKEIGIKEGDSIVIPSISSNIFGIVEKVESKSTDSFQSVLFKSPVNIQELSFVEIVGKKK